MLESSRELTFLKPDQTESLQIVQLNVKIGVRISFFHFERTNNSSCMQHEKLWAQISCDKQHKTRRATFKDFCLI